MGGDSVIEPDIWCQRDILTALGNLRNMVHNAIRPEFPSEARITISKYTVAAGGREDGWVVQVLKGKAIVLTPSCNLILYPDIMYLHRYSSDILQYEAVGTKMKVNANEVNAEKEVYEAKELYELVLQTFRELLKHALEVVLP